MQQPCQGVIERHLASDTACRTRCSFAPPPIPGIASKPTYCIEGLESWIHLFFPSRASILQKKNNHPRCTGIRKNFYGCWCVGVASVRRWHCSSAAITNIFGIRIGKLQLATSNQQLNPMDPGRTVSLFLAEVGQKQTDGIRTFLGPFSSHLCSIFLHPRALDPSIQGGGDRAKIVCGPGGRG